MPSEQDSRRQEEMRKLISQGDQYKLTHKYPARMRVGRAIAARAFPKGATTAVTPEFHIELDIALPPEHVAMD
jgi:hypothetical protein